MQNVRFACTRWFFKSLGLYRQKSTGVAFSGFFSTMNCARFAVFICSFWLQKQHRGVEKWYLARLITLRPRFDSGPRNTYVPVSGTKSA